MITENIENEYTHNKSEP